MSSQEFERKLTAILSADVAGYSRLMGEDEDFTIKTLTGHREMMATLIREHKGRVIDSPGDNLLAVFSSVTRAVDCAVEIQREMAERNEELSDDRKMEYRIGVNLGDVIEEGDRIYGDGVNIAARLESLAEPGGICISGFVYNQVKNRLKLEYEYLGEQSVKNIKEPVPVYRVLSFPGAAAHRVIKAKETAERSWRNTVIIAVAALLVLLGILAIWNYYPRGPSIEPASIEPEQAPLVSDIKEAPKTIAVLPFVNLSSDPEQEYFVDGLSEELINSLTKIPDLLVTARTSSFTFKGTDKKVQEIANELGVAHILEGSVRKAGNALRITAQLIRAVDGFHLWSETYDHELKDIFAVQEDIATAVSDELKMTLGIEGSIRTLGGTDNVEAYELYLIANAQYSTDVVMASQALESIDAAIDLDSRFALAWAKKAGIHNVLAIFGPSNNSLVEKDMALNAAMKAIELEPNLAEAYDSLGAAKFSKGDWIGAELAYSKARELATKLTDDSFAYFHICVGNFKRTNKILEVARKYDPLNVWFNGFYILSFGLLGDNERFNEENEYAKALLKDQWKPNDYNKTIYSMIIWSFRLGADDSISSDEIVWSHPISDVAKDHLKSPKEGLAELRRIYQDNENLSSSENLFISLWAAYFGDSDFAMDAMEKGISIESGGLFIIWYPAMREVRKTPRYKKFVREIGLVDYWNEFGWPEICRPVGDDDFVCD